MKKTKVALNHYETYLRSSAYTLRDVYKSWSDEKERAFRYCRDLMEDLGGYGLKILSGNTFCFTVGFEFPDRETGEVCFAYITRDYDRYYPI